MNERGGAAKRKMEGKRRKGKKARRSVIVITHSIKGGYFLTETKEVNDFDDCENWRDVKEVLTSSERYAARLPTAVGTTDYKQFMYKGFVPFTREKLPAGVKLPTEMTNLGLRCGPTGTHASPHQDLLANQWAVIAIFKGRKIFFLAEKNSAEGYTLDFLERFNRSFNRWVDVIRSGNVEEEKIMKSINSELGQIRKAHNINIDCWWLEKGKSILFNETLLHAAINLEFCVALLASLIPEKSMTKLLSELTLECLHGEGKNYLQWFPPEMAEEVKARVAEAEEKEEKN